MEDCIKEESEDFDSQEDFRVDQILGRVRNSDGDPGGITLENALSSRSVSSRVTFRSLAEASSVADMANYAADSFIDVHHRDVDFEQDSWLPHQQSFLGNLSTPPADGDAATISFSRLSTTLTQDATLPMAMDNERFFLDSEDGYFDVLNAARIQIERMSRSRRNRLRGEANIECTYAGLVWRWCLQCLLRFTTDPINRLRLTRGLQDSLTFLNVYESFVLGALLQSLDLTDRVDAYYMHIAFRNRNISRILVRNVMERWEWIWHLNTELHWNRLFVVFGQLPFLGSVFLRSDENCPYRDNESVLVVVFNWLVCLLQAIVCCLFRKKQPNDEDAVLNLTPETTGREQRNRKLYGNDHGRKLNHAFRLEHRLNVDESIVHSFMLQPELTLVNNGVEHVLCCIAKHWQRVLYQENGNFSHNRLELLNPFEVLRYHMPVVLTVLANLRGRTDWDSRVLAPMVQRLQLLNPAKVRDKSQGPRDVERGKEASDTEVVAPCQAGKRLVEAIMQTVVTNVCAEIPARMDPLRSWLITVDDAFSALIVEAEVVRELVARVDIGIKMGYHLVKLVDWKVPSDQLQQKAIINYILNTFEESDELPHTVVCLALRKLSSQDQRTLRELVTKNDLKTRVAQLLLGRVSTLLEREIRRNRLDRRIQELSSGEVISPSDLQRNRWYWVQESQKKSKVCLYVRSSSDQRRMKFVEVDTLYSHLLQTEHFNLRDYIPIAEAISRAQRLFMTLELEHCKRFSYNCFMEFGSSMEPNSLRTRLRRLVTLSQMSCSELDKARINLLSEISNSVKSKAQSRFGVARRVCPPQNVIVLGGEA
jgi:hypothetical protein